MDPSRICIHCGKEVAPDRQQRCNHCGEWFYNPADPARPTTAPKEGVRAPTSMGGLFVGIVIALAVPVSDGVLAFLVVQRIAPYDQTKALLGPLASIALAEVLLGPIGIGIAGWSAGIRSAFGWLALYIVAIPPLVLLWLYCLVSLSGALGEPF